MKHFGKKLLGTAALFLVVGIGVTMAGRAMGGETSLEIDAFGRTYSINANMLSFNLGILNSKGHNSDVRTTGAQDLEAFQSIDVDVDLGDVVIQQGGSYGVALDWSGKGYELHWTNENGVLTVWSTSTAMNVGRFDSTVTITVPQGARFDSVLVRADLGKVDLAGFYAETLDANTSLGDMQLENIQTENAILTLELGKLTVDTFSGGSVDVVASLGDVNGKNMDVRDTLTVDADLGTVDLSGTFRTYTQISADMGDVRLDTDLPADQCSYDLDVDMGSIKVNGKKYDESAKGGSGEHFFQADASMGSIELNFKG